VRPRRRRHASGSRSSGCRRAGRGKRCNSANAATRPTRDLEPNSTNDFVLPELGTGANDEEDGPIPSEGGGKQGAGGSSQQSQPQGLQCKAKSKFLVCFAAIMSLSIVCSSVREVRDRNFIRLSDQTQQAIIKPLDTRDFSAIIDSCAGKESCIARAVSNFPIHETAKDGNIICDHVVIGSHHKTGTVLANKIFKVLCPDGSSHRSTKVKPHDYISGTPFVHFIRDPLEVVVSAYQYHLVTTESWAITSGYQEKLRNASLTDGLEIEYARSLHHAIEEEANAYRWTTQAQPRPQDIFTIRASDIAERDAFRLTMLLLLKWLGLPMNPDPLESCCFVSKETHQEGAQHVSKASEKPAMRQIVMSKHGREIINLRQDMGFPLAGLEPEGDWEKEASQFDSTKTVEVPNS